MRIDQRPRGFGGRVHGGAQVDAFPAQFHDVAGDPRDIEQIVGDPHQVLQLALHRRLRLFDHRRVVACQAHDFERGADRRQRVAELV